MTTTIYQPLPIRIGARAVSDTDPILLDFSQNLLPFNDTLASVLSVTITRVDGGPMTSNDLTRSASAIASPTSVIIGLLGGVANSDYYITCEVARSSGSIISRTIAQYVAEYLG